MSEILTDDCPQLNEKLALYRESGVVLVTERTITFKAVIKVVVPVSNIQLVHKQLLGVVTAVSHIDIMRHSPSICHANANL